MSYTLDADWCTNTNGPMGSKLGICQHHSGGTTIDMIGTFYARNTSAHYGVEPGHVRQFVEDASNAWAAGDTWANNRLIHVEAVNSGGASQGWPVADGTVDTLVELLADMCREHGWPKLVVGENYFGHRDFYSTECPGVLYARLGEIASRVNVLLGGAAAQTEDTEEDMNCIYQPNGQSYLVYYDGSACHPLAHPDEVEAINMVYRAIHGRDIPIIALGTKDAPWANRFEAAVKRTS